MHLEDTPFFCIDDVVKLIRFTPYVRLVHKKNVLNIVYGLVENGNELIDVFSQYPKVLYEPLDQHYVLLRCIGSTNEELISDLCQHGYSWRGIIVAAWLTLLSPQKEFKSYLLNARKHIDEGGFLVDLAIAEIDGVILEDYEQLHEAFYSLRKLLNIVEAPCIKLSPYVHCSNDYVAKVRQTYKEQGLSSALTLIHS